MNQIDLDDKLVDVNVAPMMEQITWELRDELIMSADNHEGLTSTRSIVAAIGYALNRECDEPD